MPLAEIRAGLKTAYETVPGIGPVLMYPPISIQTNHTLFSRLTGFEDASNGQVKGKRWLFASRFCILWQEPETAETDLDTFAPAIIAAIEADRHLGGALGSGIATITAGDADWMTIKGSDVVWLYMDFDVAVLDKSVT